MSMGSNRSRTPLVAARYCSKSSFASERLGLGSGYPLGVPYGGGFVVVMLSTKACRKGSVVREQSPMDDFTKRLMFCRKDRFALSPIYMNFPLSSRRSLASFGTGACDEASS